MKNIKIAPLSHMIQKKSKDNEYYTPDYAIDMIKDFIPQLKGGTVIWEAFTLGNPQLIESSKYLYELGYNGTKGEVLTTSYDFFEITDKATKETLINYTKIGWNSDNTIELSSCKSFLNKIDICISNPPYATPKGKINIKKRIIERLCSINKPFMLLLPTLFLQTKIFKSIVDKYGLFQFIIPSKKIQFYKIINDEIIRSRSKHLKGCSFYTCWICRNINLPKDINFV